MPERLCVVTGRASDGDSQSAPITDRPAFAWGWEFYSHSRFGPGSGGWSGVDAGTDSVPFTIDDGSGPIQVDPSNAELDLSEEKTVECAPDSPPDGAAAAIDLDVGGKQFRFVERILPPGGQVTAIGEPSDGSLNPDLLIVGDRGAVLRRYGYRVFKYGIGGGAVSMVSLLITAAGFGAL
jgi:hypothetical protein